MLRIQPRPSATTARPYTARGTRIFATKPGLRPCFTPVKSPESNGISDAFVNTLKRDYVVVTPLPNARSVRGRLRRDGEARGTSTGEESADRVLPYTERQRVDV